MNSWRPLAALFLATLALRLCHLHIVWVEEAYPASAAIQMSEYGKTLYQDIWFDKPPGAVYFYRLFDAQAGWPLRLAGTCFVFACGLAAYFAARRLWGRETEALAAVVHSIGARHMSAPRGAVNFVVRKGRDGRMDVSRAPIPDMPEELKRIIKEME